METRRATTRQAVPRRRGDEPTTRSERRHASHRTVPRRRGDEPVTRDLMSQAELDPLFPAGAGMNRVPVGYRLPLPSSPCSPQARG